MKLIFSGLLFALLATVLFQAVEGRKKCLFICNVVIGKRNNLANTRSCPVTCGRYCPGDSCNVVCTSACLLQAEADLGNRVKPFPREFKTYDHDDDGFITLKELADTLQADVETSSAALKLTDDNGDGRLSEAEFNAAPYHKIKEEEEKQDGKREI